MKKLILIFLIFFWFTQNIYSQVWYSLDNGVNGPVSTFKVHNNELFVGGGFAFVGGLDSISSPDGFKATQIAKWNGINWDTVRNADGEDLGGMVKSIEFYNNEIYVGGNFVDLSATPWREYLAKIDSNFHWCDVGNIGYPCTIVSILRIKDKLYIAGDFSWIGSFSNDYHHIVAWDNTNFSKLENGLQGSNGHAYDIEEYNGQLIVGGSFDWAGDTSAYSVAAWDGQKWYPLDTGLLGTVYALTLDTINNFLYAGGTIDYAGGNGDMTRIHNIARWDGYEWIAVGNDSLSIFYGGINSIAMYHNYLYAGGNSRTGTIIDTILTKWDGNSWHKIDGPNETINCLIVYNDELYVGGFFDYIIDSLYNHIASYYEPPDTSCDYLQAIIQPKNIVLKISDSTTVHFYNNIILGSSWNWDFGDGGTDTVRMPVHTYADTGMYNVSVIVTYQNCTDTAYTTITIVDDTGIKDKENDEEYLGQNIPNPFKNTTIIPYYVPYNNKGFLQITDTKGELVDEYALKQGKNKIEISMAAYKNGVYFYSIVIDGVVKQTKKMVIQ